MSCVDIIAMVMRLSISNPGPKQLHEETHNHHNTLATTKRRANSDLVSNFKNSL